MGPIDRRVCSMALALAVVTANVAMYQASDQSEASTDLAAAARYALIAARTDPSWAPIAQALVRMSALPDAMLTSNQIRLARSSHDARRTSRQLPAGLLDLVDVEKYVERSPAAITVPTTGEMSNGEVSKHSGIERRAVVAHPDVPTPTGWVRSPEGLQAAAHALRAPTSP